MITMQQFGGGNNLIFRQVNFTIGMSAGSNASITAPNIDGYKFLTWSSYASAGWVGALTSSSPLSQSTTIWVTASRSTSDNTNNARAWAMYEKL